MNFVRTLAGPRIDCKPGPAEPVNQITSWMDLSSVYGSDNNRVFELRTFERGLMRTSPGDLARIYKK